ncbi:MAG: hypothetical protein C0594_07445 [Marinilabiliales bacterium]|nr:MAG: hypothetical protein C0594_07445 [Marinilabiliales bacterium]
MKAFLLFIIPFLLAFVAVAQKDMHYFKDGQDKMEEGKFEEAKKIFSEGIEKKAFNQKTLTFGRAFANYRLNNFEESIEDLKIIIAEDAYYSDAYWLMGRIYYEQGKKWKALRQYNKAIKTQANSYLYSNLGLLKLKMNREKAALKDFDYALRLDDENPYAYSNRALLYIKQGRFDLASKDIETSMLLDSSNPFVYKHKGLMMLKVNNTESACECFHKAIELGYRKYDDEVDQLLKEHCK